MNWDEAVAAMKAGNIVRRKSEMWTKELLPNDPDDEGIDGAGITETGEEGCYLAHAWSADEKAVMVFMGASSRVTFVPDDWHRTATDWIIVEKKNA